MTTAVRASDIERAPHAVERTRGKVLSELRRLAEPWSQWAILVLEDASKTTAHVGSRANIVGLFRAAALATGRADVAEAFPKRAAARANELPIFIVCPGGWVLEFAAKRGAA